jgi:precorrin-6Y C5,15-methyltransferase (decarboxylating)
VTPSEPKIYIAGVGGDGLAGLTSRARDMVLSADHVLGAEHALDLVPELKAERVRIGPDLQELVRLLETHYGRRRMVVLATGDPLFYGIARCPTAAACSWLLPAPRRAWKTPS